MARDLKRHSAGLRQAVFDNLADSFGDLERLLESPIEEAVFWALLGREETWALAAFDTVLYCPGGVKEASFGAPWCPVVTGQNIIGKFTIAPQVPVTRESRDYRIDFGVLVESPDPKNAFKIWIAVECDGHDFHERTKEQAARDKRKDRDLQCLGWTVARFTGSEIYRSPEDVANAIWAMAEASFSRQWDEAYARWSAEEAAKGEG
jgi:very-short-patch-repair endonuclease